MQKNINSIVRVFPDYEEKIEYLFLNDPSFRDLCTDYILCASKVLDMKMDLEDSSDQVKEYEDVQRNLELEILKMITIKRNNYKKL